MKTHFEDDEGVSQGRLGAYCNSWHWRRCSSKGLLCLALFVTAGVVACGTEPGSFREKNSTDSEGLSARYFDFSEDVRSGYFNAGDPEKIKEVFSRSEYCERTDSTVNSGWGRGAPDCDEEIGREYFAIHWKGFVTPKYSEKHTFIVTSDDGIKLTVNDGEPLEDWTMHGRTEDRKTISLVAGEQYPIEIWYFEWTGNSIAKLEWQSKSQPRQVVPSESLSKNGATPPPTGPGRCSSDDECDSNKYCADDSRCKLGCRRAPNDNCTAGKVCNEHHQCVTAPTGGCSSDDECDSNKYCADDNQCQFGCRRAPNDNCRAGKICDEQHICVTPPSLGPCKSHADCRQAGEQNEQDQAQLCNTKQECFAPECRSHEDCHSSELCNANFKCATDHWGWNTPTKRDGTWDGKTGFELCPNGLYPAKPYTMIYILAAGYKYQPMQCGWIYAEALKGKMAPNLPIVRLRQNQEYCGCGLSWLWPSYL